MTPDRWMESFLGAVAILGGIVTWAFSVHTRLSVLERIFADHVKDKAEALGELKHDIHEIKQTLNQLTRRCIAFRHFDRATLAGELDDEAQP